MKQVILNSSGEPIKLNRFEQSRADALQRQFDAELKNALGFQVDITTLTAISKSIVEQKFYTVAFADYVPVRVGEGAWSSEILTYRSYSIGGDFAEGVVDLATDNSRLASASTGVDKVTVPVKNWAKQIDWTFFELQEAARSGNWDVVSSKERSRKENWDLGLQEVAFWGLKGTTNVKGLLTQSDVNANSSLIQKYINAMSEAEFQTLLQGIIEAYRANSQRTAMPNRFIIPEADYNGLAVSVSEDFPLKSKLARLEESFKLITRNANFQILPSAYSDQATNAAITGLNKNRYVLMNANEDTIRMDIPVDYTNTLQNTINGFQFQNVGYGQFTGVQTYRPREVLYFDWAA